VPRPALTTPGGLAVTCSCSGRVSRAQFDELDQQPRPRAVRSIQILETSRCRPAITRGWPASRRPGISSAGSSVL